MPMDTEYLEPDEVQPLTGLALIQEVAFYKQTADETGDEYDPEWDQWVRDDPVASELLRRVRGGA